MPKIQIDQDIIEDIISYHDCAHVKRDDSCVNCALKSRYEQETGKHSDDIMRAPGIGPAHLRKESKINPAREQRPIKGSDRGKAIPLARAAPTRMPVKEPGPIPTAMA